MSPSTTALDGMVEGLIAGRADARRVPALVSARAAGDAPSVDCVILIDQQE
jgi:hypothetical protein